MNKDNTNSQNINKLHNTLSYKKLEFFKDLVKINKPKKLKTRYLDYKWIVTYKEVGRNSIKKRYFYLRSDASSFYRKKLKQLMADASRTDEQSAEDILEFRKATAIATIKNLPTEFLFHRYLEWHKKIRSHSDEDITLLIHKYISWRKTNNTHITLNKAIDEYIIRISNSQSARQLKNLKLNSLNVLNVISVRRISSYHIYQQNNLKNG